MTIADISSDETLVTLQNISSMVDSGDTMSARPLGVLLMPEHSLKPADIGDYRRMFRDRGWTHFELTSTDPEQGGYHAGIAAAGYGGKAVIKLGPRTDRLRRYEAQGRAILTAIAHGDRAFLNITVYGWPLADGNDDIAAKNDALLQAAACETEAWPDMPSMVSGDLNASLGKLPTAGRMLERGWRDAGAWGAHWGDDASDIPTCFADSRTKGTRRDYILLSPGLVPRVRRVRVPTGLVVRTHRMVQVVVGDPPKCDDAERPLKLRRWRGLDAALTKDFEVLHGIPPRSSPRTSTATPRRARGTRHPSLHRSGLRTLMMRRA